MSPPRRPLRWAWLGRRPYRATWELQERVRRAIRAGATDDHLLLLEHDPVFTIGRNASRDDVLAPAEWLERVGVAVEETNRGGKVTYHGPGQLVGYPIVDLDPDRRDVRRYVRDLQTVLVRTLAELGLEAEGRSEQSLIGVWVGDAKIASIGVHLARWVTLHGFALNLTTDLDHFGGIVACGLQEVTMTSVEELTGRRVATEDVARSLVPHFTDVFGRSPVEVGPDLELP